MLEMVTSARGLTDLVPEESSSRNQLAESRAERRRLPHDLLREALEMLGRTRQEREQVPDLRVLRPALLHLFDQRAKRARLGIEYSVPASPMTGP